MMAIDAHAHCGITIPIEEIMPLWREAGIDGGVLFSPAEEIYDRCDYRFTDSQFYFQSRQKVHRYLESLVSESIYAYWFVWNDFALPEESFSGIKWHRHANEPPYDYASEKCSQFVEHACRYRLPIILEEEFGHTLNMVRAINGRTVVIIPHFGMLNGGYRRLKQAGLFENPAVYVDTALAGASEIKDFASDYGVERILFGSDYPFGLPAQERSKVEKIFGGKEREKVLADNILSLLKASGGP